jgi:quercetin dioxygenase-like cupin family protein
MRSRRDRDEWGADGFFFTEAARGGPLTWRAGASRLEGDKLGPVRHVHDDAAECFFMFSGSARFEVGGEEIVLEEGQVLLVPPDAPHNVLGNVGEGDAAIFCVVAPNVVDNKWRIDDFKPGSEELRGEVGAPFDDGCTLRSGTVTARPVTLRAGAPPLAVEPEGHEIVYLVVDGELCVRLEGGLSGAIPPGRYLHVREGVEHELWSAGECRVLRVDLAFAMWSGIVQATGDEKSVD